MNIRTFMPVLSALSISLGLANCQPSNSPPPAKTAQSACLGTTPSPQLIPSGSATIGRDDAYREEAPARRIEMKSFDMDATEVTNAQFKLFVGATGYVTDAEKTQAGFNVPGGAVFTPPSATNPSCGNL